MKRKILFILMILALTGMVQAQVMGRRQNAPRTQAPEKQTISGTLVVANGMPALKSGDDTYLIAGISRLVGFIDGLKEGAQVTVEGYAIARPGNSDIKVFRPSKITLNGKDYDMSLPFGNMGQFRQRMYQPFNDPVPRQQPPRQNWNPRAPQGPGRQNTPRVW